MVLSHCKPWLALTTSNILLFMYFSFSAILSLLHCKDNSIKLKKDQGLSCLEVIIKTIGLIFVHYYLKRASAELQTFFTICFCFYLNNNFMEIILIESSFKYKKNMAIILKTNLQGYYSSYTQKKISQICSYSGWPLSPARTVL